MYNGRLIARTAQQDPALDHVGTPFFADGRTKLELLSQLHARKKEAGLFAQVERYFRSLYAEEIFGNADAEYSCIAHVMSTGTVSSRSILFTAELNLYRGSRGTQSVPATRRTWRSAIHSSFRTARADAPVSERAMMLNDDASLCKLMASK